jgi:rare lipoprotein A (peptidoglycan hydrolase)
MSGRKNEGDSSMTTRASRVLPGVLASFLLAGSFLAVSSPAAADTPPRKPLTHEHRRPAAGTRTQKSAHKPSKTTIAAARRRPPAHAATTAFVDDALTYARGTDGQVQWHQSGIASWYGGKRWQGHRMSSGALYDENALTAAHATLPLGSRVRVSLPNSDRSIIVTITDRPGTRTRIIDLSRGAASALGILTRGVAVVMLTPG